MQAPLRSGLKVAADRPATGDESSTVIVQGYAGMCRDKFLCRDGRFRFRRQARKLQTSKTLVREQVLSCGASWESDERLAKEERIDQ